MFRRLPTALPDDPSFPHNLRKLGYFINSEGFIKKIDFPDDDFQFWITNNARYNDVNREAMHACIRNEVLARLNSLSIHPLYLPTLTPIQPSPSTIPSLPILTTPLPLLPQKKRLIIFLNAITSDLAILAYRLLSKTGGIDAGSAIDFVKEIYRRAGGEKSPEAPGIMMLNPGQLLYSYRLEKALTPISWDAMKRRSAVHPVVGVHPVLNHVPENNSVREHLEFVFGKILKNEEYVAKGTEIYLVGLSDGGDELVKFLEANWTTLHTTLNIRALALTAPLNILPSTSHISLTNTPFLHFMATRAKAWAMSDLELGAFLAGPTASPLQDDEKNTAENGNDEESKDMNGGQGKEEATRSGNDLESGASVANTTGTPLQRDANNTSDNTNGEKSEHITNGAQAEEEATKTSTNEPLENAPWNSDEAEEEEDPYIHLCPTVSGGESVFAELIMPKAYNSILDWFKSVARDDALAGGIAGVRL